MISHPATLVAGSGLIFFPTFASSVEISERFLCASTKSCHVLQGNVADLLPLGSIECAEAQLTFTQTFFRSLVLANLVEIQNMILKLFGTILTVGALVSSGTHAANQTVAVGDFSKATLAGWERKAFKGDTKYNFVYDAVKKATVLQAVSDGAASGRFRRLVVDLSKTPILNWSWKISDPLSGIDENAKDGDDFSARIYVVVERGIMSMNSLSVNYVWASQHPAASTWSSPFTNRVRLVAMDTGPTGLNTWVSHKRNVRNDLKDLFGEDITLIDAVALMTDTDNSGGHARAYYGDIWFSAE
jgi:hypothetical protein